MIEFLSKDIVKKIISTCIVVLLHLFTVYMWLFLLPDVILNFTDYLPYVLGYLAIILFIGVPIASFILSILYIWVMRLRNSKIFKTLFSVVVIPFHGLFLVVVLYFLFGVLCPSALTAHLSTRKAISLIYMNFKFMNGIVLLYAIWTVVFPIYLIWFKREKVKSTVLTTFICLTILITAVDGYSSAMYVKRMFEGQVMSESEYDLNIDVEDYLPFNSDSKIAVLNRDASLDYSQEDESSLPILDGAAAFFPVYSSYVNAVYPMPIELSQSYVQPESPFQYSNTRLGYNHLTFHNTDIFFGFHPSESQIEQAERYNTTFKYTPIGKEAFVFFTHKDNPVDSLTIEQIKGIYSGEITNWKEVGGENSRILAYQRNADSGSQSMLERFMGDRPIMKAPSTLTSELMSRILYEVGLEYRNNSSAIGFSFYYYATSIRSNPTIKMLKVEGIEPTYETIENGTYPIIEPILAVTYEGQTNEKVDELLNWILSDEGQILLKKSGYVPINKIEDSSLETYYAYEKYTEDTFKTSEDFDFDEWVSGPGAAG